MGKKIEKFLFDCPICDSHLFYKIYGVSIFGVCLCRSCGLVCLNPRMDERGYMEKFYKNYRKDLFGDYLADDVDVRELYAKPVENLAAKKVVDDLKGYLSSEAKILEVGCGAGQTLILLKQNGFKNIMGIDPDLGGGYCEGLKEFYNIECYSKSLSEFTQKIGGKEKFDCIILDQIIEHFVEPAKDLKILYSLMAENSILYIATPDVYKFYRPFTQFAIPHTFYFSHTTMEILLKKCGFKVERYFDSLMPIHMALLARKEGNIEPATYDRREYDKILTYFKKNKFLFILLRSKRFAEEIFIDTFGENAYLRSRVLLKNFVVAAIKGYRRYRK